VFRRGGGRCLFSSNRKETARLSRDRSRLEHLAEHQTANAHREALAKQAGPSNPSIIPYMPTVHRQQGQRARGEERRADRQGRVSSVEGRAEQEASLIEANISRKEVYARKASQCQAGAITQVFCAHDASERTQTCCSRA
jgi:hypothetical protein